MRMRVGLAVLAALCCLGAGPSWAAPARNMVQGAGPGMAAAGHWRLSARTAWQARENFQDTVEFSSESGVPGSEAATSMKLNNDRLHMATLGYGLHRRLTVFAQAGLAEGGVLAETLSNGQWEARLKPVFVWGLGARGLVWEDPRGLGLTVGLSYLRWDDRGIDHWHSTNGWTTDQGGVAVEGKVDYWRVEGNALAHWRLGPLLPYLGLGYAYSELKDEDHWDRPDGSWAIYSFSSKGQDNWGLLAGVEADLGRGLGLVLSGAIFSRQEVGLSLTWGF